MFEEGDASCHKVMRWCAFQMRGHKQSRFDDPDVHVVMPNTPKHGVFFLCGYTTAATEQTTRRLYRVSDLLAATVRFSNDTKTNPLSPP